MEPIAILGAGIFVAVMIPTILISSMPRISIRLLELVRLFPKGSLYHDKRNYVNGAGQHVYRGVYYSIRNGSEHFENMRVFLSLLFTCLIPSVILVAVLMVCMQ